MPSSFGKNSGNISSDKDTHPPTKITKYGKSFLLQAIRNQSLEEVTELLKNGTDVNAQDKYGNTPLSTALCNSPENLEIIKEILKYGASVTKCNINDETPLHLALRNRNSVEVVQEIIKYGADVNAKDKYGGTPIFEALCSSEANLKSIQELVKHGASFLETDMFGQNPLHIAIRNEQSLKVIQELLKHDIDINETDRNGDTPLFYTLCGKTDNLKIITKLFKYGASVLETNFSGQTPLHVALETGKSLKTIQKILKWGADINAADRHGKTPLFYALENDLIHFEIIKELLKHGASIAAIDKSGDTPLHVALKRKKTSKFILEILRYGADVNSKNGNGETPIFVAFEHCDRHDFQPVVELLKHGASMHEFDDDYFVKDYWMEKIIKYILIEHPDSINCSYCEELKDLHAEYIANYKKELHKMKNEYIFDKISLYDLIVNRYDYGKLFSKQNDVLSKSNFLKKINKKYPLYHDVIMLRLESRTYILSHFYDITFVININNKVFHINSCCLRIIGKYLPKQDLKHFICAFSD